MAELNFLGLKVFVYQGATKNKIIKFPRTSLKVKMQGALKIKS